MSEVYPSLFLKIDENRDNIIILGNFHACVENELRKYNSSAALRKYMEREDFDSICTDQISAIKGISGNIGVKETRSIYANYIAFNKDIYN